MSGENNHIPKTDPVRLSPGLIDGLHDLLDQYVTPEVAKARLSEIIDVIAGDRVVEARRARVARWIGDHHEPGSGG